MCPSISLISNHNRTKSVITVSEVARYIDTLQHRTDSAYQEKPKHNNNILPLVYNIMLLNP